MLTEHLHLRLIHIAPRFDAEPLAVAALFYLGRSQLGGLTPSAAIDPLALTFFVQSQSRRHLGIAGAASGASLVGQYPIQPWILGKQLQMHLVLALLATQQGARTLHQPEKTHRLPSRNGDWRRQLIELIQMARRLPLDA